MRICALLLLATQWLLGCKAPDTRSDQMQRWLAKSRKGCKSTASVLKRLRLGVAAFEKVFEAELNKTKVGQRQLRHYNPHLLSRLEGVLHAVDTSGEPLASRLTQDIWSTHYRFVKNAPDVLPRLHRLLVLLAQLRATVAIARRMEKRYKGQLQKKLASPAKPKTKASHRYGVIIKGNTGAYFAGKLGKPVRNEQDHCVETTLPKAMGFKASDNACYWFGTEPKGTPKCMRLKHTLRIFQPDDQELTNRMQCRGQDQIVYTAHLYHLMQIKLILAKIGKLDLRGLTIAFRRSAE